MVFDPTFRRIDEKAEGLPDLAGADGAADPELLDPDGGIAEASSDRVDEAQDGVIEGEAEASVVAEALPVDDLPTYREDS